MSRSAAGVSILAYTEEHSKWGPYTRRVDSLAWNTVPPPAIAALMTSEAIVHQYSAVLTEAEETYSDWHVQERNVAGGGSPTAQAACHHLPYPGVCTITELWVVNGIAHEVVTVDSGAYGLNVHMRRNLTALSVLVVGQGRHEITGIRWIDESITLHEIDYFWPEDVNYKLPPSVDPAENVMSGTAYLQLWASGDRMFADCQCVRHDGIGGAYIAPPVFTAQMSQAIQGSMSFALDFRPVAEDGKPVSLPVQFKFGPYYPYTISRTAPVTETVTFPSRSGSGVIQMERNAGEWPGGSLGDGGNPAFEDWREAKEGSFLWPPYYGCGFTKVTTVLPSSVIGPLFNDTTAESEIPPRIEMYPHHRYHAAAGATCQDLATISLPPSRDHVLGAWAQVGSTAGASIVGNVLTAGALEATFRASTTVTKFSPYRWLKLIVEATAAGSVDIAVEMSFGGVTTGNWTFALVAGENILYLDLSAAPDLSGFSTPLAPPTAFSKLTLAFANNSIEVTECEAVVRYSAEAWILGAGGSSNINVGTPPWIYGQVDGHRTVRERTEDGGFPVDMEDSLIRLEDAGGLDVTIIDLTPAAWVGPLQHGGFVAAFNEDGSRVGKINLLDGTTLKSTCYSRAVFCYAGAGGDPSNMFGGSPFPVTVEFIYGSVATATVVPAVSNTLVVKSPNTPPFTPVTVPGLWHHAFVPNGQGWARKAAPHDPTLSQAQIYSVEQARKSMAESVEPTTATYPIGCNRTYGFLRVRGIPLIGSKPSYDVSDSMRHLRAYIDADDRLWVGRADQQLIWEDTDTGLDVASAAIAIDKANRAQTLLLVAGIGGTVYLYASPDEGRNFTLADTIASGANPAIVVAQGGRRCIYWLDGTTIKGQVRDASNTIVRATFSAVAGVDATSTLAVDTSILQGGVQRFLMLVVVSGALTQYTSPDGVTWS